MIVELLSILKKKSTIRIINSWSIAYIFCVVSKVWNSQFCISYWITVERWKKPWLHHHLQTNYIVFKTLMIPTPMLGSNKDKSNPIGSGWTCQSVWWVCLPNLSQAQPIWLQHVRLSYAKNIYIVFFVCLFVFFVTMGVSGHHFLDRIKQSNLWKTIPWALKLHYRGWNLCKCES